MDVNRTKSRIRATQPAVTIPRAATITARTPEISTEAAVSLFGILAGIGGATSQLVAAGKLSSVESGTVTLGQLAPAIVVSILAATAAASLLPGDVRGLPGV